MSGEETHFFGIVDRHVPLSQTCPNKRSTSEYMMS